MAAPRQSNFISTVPISIWVETENGWHLRKRTPEEVKAGYENINYLTIKVMARREQDKEK